MSTSSNTHPPWRPPSARRAATSWCAVAFLSLGSCVGDSVVRPEASDGGDAAPTERACTPDPAVVRAHRACTVDDQCPCGAHCELGVCKAECGAGVFACYRNEYCDTFGRCRPEAERAKALMRVPAVEGELTLGASSLTFGAASDARTLEYVLSGVASTAVRFDVGAPYQVRCDPSGEWGAECTLPSVPGATVRQLEVRVAPGTSPMPTALASLHAWWGHNARTVTVAVQSATMDAAGLQGTYEGTATLNGGLLGTNVSVPITARVFAPAAGGAGSISFTDPSTLFTGTTTAWVGSLAVDAVNGSGTVTLPARALWTDVVTTAADLPVGALISPTAATRYNFVKGATATAASTVTLTLPVTYTNDGTSPAGASWAISLRRTGDVGLTTAETVSAAATLAAQPMSTLSAWETRLANSYRSLSAIPLAQGDAMLKTLADASSPERRLETCKPSLFATASDRVNYLTRLLYEVSPHTAELGEVTDLNSFSGGADLNGPLPTREAVTAALLAPFFTSVTSYWALNTRPQLVDWAFTASQTNTSATTLPCDINLGRSSYSTAFCGQNISNETVGISRCGYFTDLGWGAYLSDLPRGAAPTATAGAISATALRFEVDYGIPLVPAPTDPLLPTRHSCSRSASTAIAFSGTRYFDFNAAPFGRPTTCAALTACALGTNSTTGGALDSSALDTSSRGVMPGTGDLRCQGGGRGFAFELDLRRDAGVNVSSDELLTTCFRDLDRLHRAAPAVTAASADVGASALFGTEGCIDAGRFFLSLTTALNDYKDGAAAPTTTLGMAKASNARIAHRLLQQWLALHAAMAVQATQYAIVPDSIRGVHTDFAVPRGVDVVDRVVQGLALFQHPRVSNFLVASTSDLRAPDYRPATAGIAANDSDPQRQHLIVQREQTLGALLNLIDPVLDTALRNNDQATITRLERALRVVIVTRADDTRLRNTLSPSTSRASWDAAYASAFTAVSGKLATLLAQLTLAQSLSNPLGIDPGEVPLYFSGDPEGPAARFTPVSDYLLGAGLSSSAWAPAAVAQAQASADAVARSFRSLATRTYQTVQTANDVSEHLESVRTDFGGQVSSYCGGPGNLRDSELLEGWQAASGAPFDAGTCYLRNDDAACRARFAAQALAAQRQAAMPQIVITRADVLNQACISSRNYITTSSAPGDPGYTVGDYTYEAQNFVTWTYAARPIVFTDPMVDALGRMRVDALSASMLDNPDAATGTTVGCGDVRPCSFDASSLCIKCRGFVEVAHEPFAYRVRDPIYRTNNRTHVRELSSGSSFFEIRSEDAVALRATLQVIEVPVTFASVFNQITHPYNSEAALAANTMACRALFTNERTEAPPNIPAPAVVDDGACYRGSLGQSVLNIRGLTIAVQIANAQFDALTNQYDIAVQTCNIQHAGAQQLASLQSAHNGTMTSLRQSKFIADQISNACGGAADCLNDIGGSLGDAVATGGGSVAFGLGACFFHVAGTVAQGVSLEFQRQMDESEQSHALLLQTTAADTDYRACMNDAGQFLTGARAASLAISQARQDMSAALYSFNQDLGAAQAAFDEGNLRLATVRNRQNTPPEFDDPLDLNVQTFRRQMRVARRVTFLAVRAVEYELQTTLAAENDVTVAESPADLQAVLDQLRLTAATRRVQGSAPAETLTILSLRDHLLQLQDTSNAPASEQALTPAQRFRSLLQDPRYAVRDANGVYLGQSIPFSINPVPTSREDRSGGVALLTGSDCAERIWSVNLSVLGTSTATQPLIVGNDEQTFARLEVHKSNSFYSQLCAPTDRDRYQSASFRPAVNLFQEPGVSGNTTAGGTVSSSSTDNAFSRARVRAHINVSRNDLETSAYVEGSSSELAGRGLFGSYALFIPASTISTTTTAATVAADAGTVRPADAGAAASTTTSTPGLNLGLVNDILLRLDYVSVARPVR